MSLWRSPAGGDRALSARDLAVAATIAAVLPALAGPLVLALAQVALAALGDARVLAVLGAALLLHPLLTVPVLAGAALPFRELLRRGWCGAVPAALLGALAGAAAGAILGLPAPAGPASGALGLALFRWGLAMRRPEAID